MSQKVKLLVRAFFAITCILLCSAAYAETLSQRYIASYGLMPESHELVQRAGNIFNNIYAVSDKVTLVAPSLRVIDSPGKPWAVALDDGAILITRGALQLCYQDVDNRTGDARLAFVLAHELAHFNARHFSSRELLKFSGPRADANAITRMMELEADDIGFLYAAMAGYSVRQLLEKKNNFFQLWAHATSSSNENSYDETHYGEANRTSLIEQRLINISEKSILYEYAIKFLKMKRYDDAAVFLKEYIETIPTKEALANLGFIFLRKAISEMDVSVATYYWLPSVYDPENSLKSNVKNLQLSSDINVQTMLKKAVVYLQMAVAADPEYLPALMNLATSFMYLGEYHEARNIIEKARAAAPGQPDVESVRALVLFEQEKEIDMWSISVELLESITQKDDFLPATYNLARLYKLRERNHRAGDLWHKLVTEKDRVPYMYRAEACMQSPLLSCSRSDEAIDNDRIATEEYQQFINMAKDSAEMVRRDDIVFNQQIGSTRVRLYRNRNNSEYLELDGRLELIVLPSTEVTWFKTNFSFTNSAYQDIYNNTHSLMIENILFDYNKSGVLSEVVVALVAS